MAYSNTPKYYICLKLSDNKNLDNTVFSENFKIQGI
jgi:hypothetical protein